METFPCANQASCHLVDTKRGCFEDVHHLQYPSGLYKNRVDSTFREAPFNKVRICRALHDAIHASGHVPGRPSREQMLADIEVGQSDFADEERELQLDLGELFRIEDVA